MKLSRGRMAVLGRIQGMLYELQPARPMSILVCRSCGLQQGKAHGPNCTVGSFERSFDLKP